MDNQQAPPVQQPAPAAAVPRNVVKLRAFPLHIGDAELDTFWTVIEYCYQDFLKGDDSPNPSFEELYTSAYTIVLHRRGQWLYDKVKALIVNHHRENTRPALLDSIEDGSFLKELSKQWTVYTTATKRMCDTLLYLDRSFIPDNKLPTVQEFCLELFRKEVILYPVIYENLKTTIKAMDIADRNSIIKEWKVWKGIYKMLSDVRMEEEWAKCAPQFQEATFLEESSKYYRDQSQSLMAFDNLEISVRRISAFIKTEEERIRHYFDKEMGNKIMTVLNDDIIKVNTPILLDKESGFKLMLYEGRADSLHILYCLLKRTSEGLNKLMTSITDTLNNQMEEIAARTLENWPMPLASTSIGTSSDDFERLALDTFKFIQQFVALKEQYINYLFHSFDNNFAFGHHIRTKFNNFLRRISIRPETIEQLITDGLLTASFVENPNEMGEDDRTLKNSHTLFKFLQEEQLFNRYGFGPKRLDLLANLSTVVGISLKRLLNADQPIEFPVEPIHLIAVETDLTEHLEGFFRDIEQSRRAMVAYANAEKPDTNERLANSQFHALAKVNIPKSSQFAECILPPIFVDTIQHFGDFYSSKYKNRKLEVHPALGSVELVFYHHGDPGKKTLILPTLMAIILLQFNDKEWITFEELQNATKIPIGYLKRALLALCSSDSRILARSGSGQNIEDGEQFSVNDQFTTGESGQITLPPIPFFIDLEEKPSASSTSSMEAQINENVVAEEECPYHRRPTIQATIVRLLKAQKQIVHEKLVAQVIAEVADRFVPEVELIKKCIESLIERDFLERDPTNECLYKYIP